MASGLIVAEPEAAYARRPRRVIDSSVFVAWLFGEPRCDEAQALIEGWQLAAPQILDYEIANAGMNKLRRKALPANTVEAVLDRFAAIEIERYVLNPVALFAMASRYDLSAYDAAYLLLAEQLAAPLVTFDEKLGRAANQHFAIDQS